MRQPTVAAAALRSTRDASRVAAGPAAADRHYDLAWSGFDVALAALLAITGFGLLRRKLWVQSTATAAATRGPGPEAAPPEPGARAPATVLMSMAKGKRDRRASIRSMSVEPQTFDPQVWAQDDAREPAPQGDEAEHRTEAAESD